MLLVMIIVLTLLCATVGLGEVSAKRQAKKDAGRTKPIDEKEMYY